MERGFLDRCLDFADGAIDSAERVVNPSRVVDVKHGSNVSPFRIVEAIDDDGVMIYVVTNGIEECTCSTLDLAQRVYRGL